MPTFDGKAEKFELFEDLSQTSLKIHNQQTEEDKINYFHSLMRGDALRTFKNITSPNREKLGEILTVFRRKYVKPQSMATAEHKFQRLVFNPANQKLIDFPDELQKTAKDAFGVAAEAIIEQFIYAKMPPHLKKSINQAHLENGRYEQIVSHLQKELELNGLEAPSEMPINTMTQQAPQETPTSPNQHATNAKHQVAIKISAVNSNEKKTKPEIVRLVPTITMVVPKQTLTPTRKLQTIPKANNINNQRDRRCRLVFPPSETCGRTNHSTEKCYLGANAANRPPPRNWRPEGQKPSLAKKCTKQLNWECPSWSPNSELKAPRLHSGAACDRPETNEISKLPPILEVVWQQTTEIATEQDNLNNTHNDSTLKTNVASQTSPPKGTEQQNHVDATEQPSANQTGNEPVPFLHYSKNSPTNIQNTEQHAVTTLNGDTTIPPLTTATPLIEEALVRDEQSNEVYLPLTSTGVLKRKHEMLYVPLDFENNLTVDALVDSEAIVSAIAQDEFHTIKQKAPNKILKVDDPLNFQIQVANGQLEKPLSTATLKIEIWDHTFAERFVLMKKVTWPMIGLHFLRNNSVVSDTKHGLLHFPHMTMQVKTASSETATEPQPVITDEALTIPPTTTKTITAFIDYPSKWDTTGTVTPLEKFTETASLLIFHSMSTIIDKRIAVRVTNTTKSQYLIKKHTQIAEFSVVTPEQSKHIKPVDMAILSMIPQGDPYLTAYLNELLRTNKPEQQDNTFWFPTPENPWTLDEYTPIQTKILNELNELKDKEELNPQDSTEPRNKLLKRFDWTNTLLTETEKQAIEDILVDYHNIFARHRLDIGMNTEFKVKLSPKDDKAVYSQSVPMPMHLKEDLIDELALMHKYGIITVLPFSKYASPIFAQRKPNGKLRLLVDLRKINNLIADD